MLARHPKSKLDVESGIQKVSANAMNIKKELPEIFQSILDSSQMICTMMWSLLWLNQNLSLIVMWTQFDSLIRYFLMIEFLS
jgi:hypothetical protein